MKLILRDLPLRGVSEKKLESLGALGVDPLRIEAFVISSIL